MLQSVLLAKTDRHTHLGSPITVLSYPEDVCPMLCLKLCTVYFNLNSFGGKCIFLFIASKEPYKPVSSKLIAKWSCNIIQQIDSVSTAHSTGAVGLTNALFSGVSLDQVFKQEIGQEPQPFRDTT